jgi:hypothetical protein
MCDVVADRVCDCGSQGATDNDRGVLLTVYPDRPAEFALPSDYDLAAIVKRTPMVVRHIWIVVRGRGPFRSRLNDVALWEAVRRVEPTYAQPSMLGFGRAIGTLKSAR